MTAIRRNQRTRIANALYEISKVRHQYIPINDIDTALREYGLKLIQEDGTDWSGIICGMKGSCLIDVADLEGNRVNSMLKLDWYKEPDQKTFEINCYLS